MSKAPKSPRPGPARNPRPGPARKGGGKPAQAGGSPGTTRSGERIAPSATRNGERIAPSATRSGERIAKVIARAGLASRREAEAMIAAGRVSVNGKAIDSPALNITPRDKVEVDGKALAAPEPARLWLYHKPTGLVTTARDEKGRETIFDKLPKGLPRVMSVGRLDLNSEGLLLLTNDGELKRKLELPATGWLRRYRVRVKGTVTEAALQPLRDGIEIEGERFQPMEVELDRAQSAANAWVTVGLREGRNREIRRAMEAVGLSVNRLIRISYGPFQLNKLKPGEVEELRPRVLRDQLGIALEEPQKGGKAEGGKPARQVKRPPRRKPAQPEGLAPWDSGPPAKPRPKGQTGKARAGKEGAGRGEAGQDRAERGKADRGKADRGRSAQDRSGKPGGKPRQPTGTPRKPR